MRRIYLQKVSQHGMEYYIGKADPRVLVKMATKIQVSTPQDAQRPLNGNRVKQIASYVEGEGILPNTLVLATNNRMLEVKQIDVKDDQGNNMNLYYMEIPYTPDEFAAYQNTLDVMDGQHRLYSFDDQWRTLKDTVDYEIGFSLFITPTLADQRKIFMICNEKQEKVSGNLLMWFREKLQMLQGSEKTYYRLVNLLNTENVSPLKGRIIMGAEKITNGIKAQQLIRVLDKAKIANLAAGKTLLDDQQKLEVISKYLKAWEKVCNFSFAAPDSKKDGAAYKIAGLRYMIMLLPVFWDRATMDKEKFTEQFVMKIINQFLSSEGISSSEVFTGESSKNNFRGETATFEFVDWSKIKIQALNSGSFNPLA